MIKKFTRICPLSGWICFARLPKTAASMSLYKNTPICSIECAERYARSIGHQLVGEHVVHENGKKHIEYLTAEPSNRVRKAIP